MRKTKTFSIEGYQPITVKELTVEQIINLLQEDSEISLLSPSSNIEDTLERFIKLCADGLSLELLKKMSPSEVLEVWEKFKEVNSAFFVIARKTGLTEILENLKETIIKDFLNLLATSLKQDTPES